MGALTLRVAPFAALLAALVATLAATGCAVLREPGSAGRAETPVPEALRLEPPPNDHASLVYGYLDMREAPTGLAWIEFRQVSPRTEATYYQMRVHEGVFYMEKFPPGVFVMGEFGGQRRDGRHLAYSLPRTSPTVRVAIEQPGLYFVGTFRYRPVTENGVRVGRFEIDRLDAPDGEAVLRRILPFAQGTAWRQRIEQRLDDAAPQAPPPAVGNR
jgi:hypothetical protein